MEDIEVVTAADLLAKQKAERGKPSFETFVKNSQSAIPANMLAEEKEWFAKTVDELKWLNDAKKTILAKNDYQAIGAKSFIKKSGVKKLAMAMGISVEIVDRTMSETTWGSTIESTIYQSKTGSKAVNTSGKGKEILWSVRARATRRDGVFCEALAVCSNYELAVKKGQDYNPQNILGTAETRASDRAVMNLLGGEVTFEEIVTDEDSK